MKTRPIITLLVCLFIGLAVTNITKSNSEIYFIKANALINNPDSTQVDSLYIDTIDVTGLFDVTDTAKIITSGVDTIYLLQEDTLIYHAQFDSTEVYLIGEIDTSIHFEKPIDSVAYYYATDESAYYIPVSENSASKLIQIDSNNQNELGERLALNITKGVGAINITTVSSEPYPVNYDLFGINIEGLFKPHSLPWDGIDGGSSEYAYDWLGELAPRVIRFPSGESSKFMHLLNNTDNTTSKGYGYDINEIARYFNKTDDDMGNLATAAAADGLTIYEEIQIEDELEMGQWMNADFTENYKDYLLKWKEQQCADHRYIDDFVELIHKIDAMNSGRPKTHVLLTINVISETASECVNIATYLRERNINVIGIEVGNETYADFYCLSVGFKNFGKYWDWINGESYLGYNDVFSSAMIADHDYIEKFNAESFNYKIGLVGKTLGGTYAFRVGGARAEDIVHCGEGDWNTELGNKYSVMSGSRPAFDAVIMHNYYSASDWYHFVSDPYNFVLNPTSCVPSPYPIVWDDLWHFNYLNPDVRIKTAFEKIRGSGFEGGETGNFTDFLMNHSPASDYPYSIQNSFLAMKTPLHLDYAANNPNKKELWVTEWNLKTKLPNSTPTWPIGYSDDLKQLMLTAPSNTFVYGYLLMQWWLKNISLNYEISNYRKNFFTIATIQGYGGGVWDDLLTLTSHQEREEQGTDNCPWEEVDCTLLTTPCDAKDDSGKKFYERNYWMRRMSYYVARLYSDIPRNSLLFVPSAFTYDIHNLNMPPMVFIDDAVNPQYIYVYFTNVKDVSQNYTIDPMFIRLMFSPDADDVDLGVPQINYIQANELYSTFGFSKLYGKQNGETLNICYDDYDHPGYEENAQMIWGDSYPPSCSTGVPADHCLTALPKTIGYFKIPVYPIYFKEGEEKSKEDIFIYPNPSKESFNFIPFCEGNDCSNEKYNIIIFTLSGDEAMKINTTASNEIKINSLPAGCYIISIENSSGKIFHKQLIKGM